MSTTYIDSGLEALSIGLSLIPVPGLPLLAVALKQMLANVNGMKICQEQAKVLHNQAQDLYEATESRYNRIKQLSHQAELKAIDHFVQDLHVEIESINDDLDKLARKPKLHLFFTYISISNMLGGHKDNLTAYANKIVVIAAVDQQDATEWMRGYLEQHSEAVKKDGEVLRQVDEKVDQLSREIHGFQEALKEGKNSPAGSLARQHARDARVILYKTRHNLSSSDLVLPIAKMNGEVERLGTVPEIAGSTCEIWKGKWLNRYNVALKVYRSGCGALDPHDQERLDRQIDLWRTMKHPNILTLLGICTLDGIETTYIPLFFVSPWVKNQDASSYVRKRHSLGDFRMRIIHDIALGLQYLHGIDIVHGGLQGSNVLISKNKSALLSDFRLTKYINGKTYFTFSDGPQTCYRWMSPEAHTLEEMTPACDIWSFAMTTLELLSDKDPYWRTKAITNLTLGITKENRKPAREDHPSAWIDDRIWNLLTRCWESDPKDRLTIDDIIVEVEAIRRDKYGWNGAIVEPEDLLA